MTQKIRNVQMRGVPVFPPEAHADFVDVNEKDIAAWRVKLSERFGIGQGKLVATEEPQAFAKA